MIIRTIYTNRLIIRAMHPEDAHYAFLIWADKESGKFYKDPYYKSPDELEQLLQGMEEWSDIPV